MSSIEIRGVEHHDEDALKACLATHPRERFGFILGGEQTPQCGVPPFDASRVPINLWAWPWTEWPLFNQTAYERDLDRIERWYAARGYYDARVTSAQVKKNDAEREVAVAIEVKEGDPVLLVRISVHGAERLDVGLQREVYNAIELRIGEPFDEALYERSKRALLEALQEASYAKAEVKGTVQVDPVQKLARVEFTLTTGPKCRFGRLGVEGNAKLPSRPILAAAGIKEGSPFSLSALRDARYAILALGPLASVELEQHVRGDQPIVDVIAKVVPGRMLRFGFGVGIDSGAFFTQESEQLSSDFAQWDVHLLARVEHRNFLGGMRKLRVEERPRIVFDKPFPSVSDISPGNLLTAELRQPSFIDARTTLVVRARWDRGPDPYGGHFQRDLVVVGLGPERYFFQGKLLVSSAINTDLFLPQQQNKPYPSNELLYLYHFARLDLRDDPRNVHRGSYFSLGVQHAGYFMPSDWNYVRLTGDSRGYVPLPGGLVLAGRARLGFMAITHTSIRVPPNTAQGDTNAVFIEDLAKYGPLSHRLRGGGFNSVRGYAPNTLGDVEYVNNRLLSGGLRQWEASLELRVPVSESFGTAFFVDAGDVSRSTSYRFNYPHTSFGFGLRYRTIVGPLRLDAALAPRGLQVIGASPPPPNGVPQSRVFGLDGALSFTIGEAF